MEIPNNYTIDKDCDFNPCISRLLVGCDHYRYKLAHYWLLSISMGEARCYTCEGSFLFWRSETL